jgi:ABC-type branched-subunit amino acid transport system substrate-binding protein
MLTGKDMYMNRLSRFSLVFTASIVALTVSSLPGTTLAGSRSAGTPGVTGKSISVGTSIPESGLAQAYSIIAFGSKAYFDYINAHGGVHGRKINFTILDDGYDPTRTRTNVSNLVTHDNVFALVDVLGTANNLAAKSIVDKYKVPLVYPATGSSLMETDKYWFPIQVTYTAEGKILTDYAVHNLHLKKIGVYYQNDDFGLEGLNAVKKEAKKDGAKVVDSENYTFGVSPPDASAQATKLRDAGAKAVIIFNVPGYFQGFIQAAHGVGLKARMLSSDTTLAYGIIQQLGALANGLVYDDYAQLPTAHTAQAKLFHTVIAKYGTPQTTPPETFTEVGFGAAQVFVHALQKAGRKLTRASFLNALNHYNKWNGSIFGKLTYTGGKHIGVRCAYVLTVKKGVPTGVTGYRCPK